MQTTVTTRMTKLKLFYSKHFAKIHLKLSIRINLSLNLVLQNQFNSIDYKIEKV